MSDRARELKPMYELNQKERIERKAWRLKNFAPDEVALLEKEDALELEQAAQDAKRQMEDRWIEQAAAKEDGANVMAGEVASLDYERWYGEDIPYLLAEVEKREKSECAARKAGTVGGSYPQDCNWPFCGCDERASKVMDTLLECGWIGNKEVEMLRGELDAEAGRVRINFRIMENLGLVNSIDGWTNQRAELAETTASNGLDEIRRLVAEVERLRAWKESAMDIMAPMQDIGREIGVKLGQPIHDKILPWILKAKEETERLGGERTRPIKRSTQL